jgi:hypothetical protein
MAIEFVGLHAKQLNVEGDMLPKCSANMKKKQ